MSKNTLVIFPLLSVSLFAIASEEAVEEVVVTSPPITNVYEVSTDNAPAADASALLKSMPGADVNRNGMLTGIAQYRGMYGSRVNVSIDGMAVTSGGPNAMDTPLHYAPMPMVDGMSVYRGIAPVSSGQQTLGGAFNVMTKQSSFSSSEEWEVSGNLSLGIDSVTQGQEAMLQTFIGNNQHQISLSLMNQEGDDAAFPDGYIVPTEYEREHYTLGYAVNIDGHEISYFHMSNETGDAGTPALPMDIKLVETTMDKLGYRGDFDVFTLDTKLVYSDVEHVMTNYHLRDNSGNKRSTLATATSCDGKVEFQIEQAGTWKVGIDHHCSEHDADISDPTNPMFFVVNFNEIEDTITGIYAETNQALTEELNLDAGLRVNQVTADAGDVGSSMAMMMNMMGTNVAALRDEFNALDKKQTDTNVDIVLGLDYSINAETTLVTAIAQKTRSASYQERFLWLPMQSTGGLADGHNYVGQVDLNPEVASEIELGIDWFGAEAMISPRLFYRDVSDYIQGVPSTDMRVIMISTMMGGDSKPLQFSNVDAKFYGFDMQWRYDLAADWTARGLVSIVRAERKDIDDNIYRVSPDHMSVALDNRSGALTTSFEVVIYDKQNRVSETNDELETAGYATANLHFNFKPDDVVTLSAGVENLFDREYKDHLAGYNRAAGSDVEVGDRLPGLGRNVYARASVSF